MTGNVGTGKYFKLCSYKKPIIATLNTTYCVNECKKHKNDVILGRINGYSVSAGKKSD